MKVSDLEVSGVTTPQDMERRVLCFHGAMRIYELSKDKDPVGLLKDLRFRRVDLQRKKKSSVPAPGCLIERKPC